MKIGQQNQFWKSFAKKSWEKKPLLAKNFESPILEIDQNEIFKMLVAYSDKCRKQKSADGFKLYVDGQMIHPEEVLQFLPVKKDQSLVGYHDRMEKYYSDYCLVCDELLQVSQKNWKCLQEFTSNLFSHVGFPNRFVEMGLYLGNYRKTPFGVHVDGCGVFSFPVVGNKTFRLWTPEFAKKNPSLDRAHNYAKFKKQSKILKATPGDMTYWPSSAWHIAESSGAFSATWSLGVWVDLPHKDVLGVALKPLLDAKLGVHGDATVVTDVPSSSRGEIRSLPKSYQQSLQSFREISSAELHDAFMMEWLKSVSKKGFKKTPLPDFSIKISIKSRIQIPESESIVWTQLRSEHRTRYAFQGTIIESSSINFKKLIMALNAGQRCLISDYLKGSKRTDDLKSIQNLLS